ncbi:APC family permease [Methanonatronarchaeum thermophilum]|uniref:APC family permease n=1 Tax=Methanonatronarchaeum thermophilum TaxID=1927129 RepID=UPI00191BBDA4|nr:APC family permease [Methanonatronarchaeum thermophilum]
MSGEVGSDDVVDVPVPEEDAEDVSIHEEGVELERTIGLMGGLTIGVGTMIGAGIFVFPGLAAGNAGPAAILSFIIGGLIALLVALPASELATAMPRSGGGYFFVSRAMGAKPGGMVGISLWFGLVFATAFYLVGFGYYAVEVMYELGLTVGFDPVVLLSVFFGVLLVAISISGTENTEKLQNLVVSLLIVILVVFLVYGVLEVVGVLGRERIPEEFAPFGIGSVFSTAALVFTSYLGFAQVATIAGDIERPSRNLPLAMVGSVVIVTVLYALTIFVATGTIDSVTLGGFGETAIIEVSRELLGVLGAIVILMAGLLATISSANASILASSRALYSVSRDRLLPQGLSKINLRYGTPHIALISAGILVVGLVLVGEVELLAEVASFLHLIMYGLICFSVIFFRRMSPDWYSPEFKTPGYPVLPVVGGVASFALIAFMEPVSRWIGIVILLIAGVWTLIYASDVELKGVLDDE